MIIVHGFKDHCGRYEPAARELARNGYAVHAMDLRGHGRSGGERYYVDRFAEYAADLRGFIDVARVPDRPVFVLAHSMGAIIACLACIDEDAPVDAMVLTGAALLPGSSVSPVLVRFAALLGRFFPRAAVVRLDLSAISRDREVVRRAQMDPLTDHGPSPARTGYELLRASRRVLDRAAQIRPPLLILHGGDDRLADPEGSRRLHEGTKGRGSRLIVYPGLYHEVLNEPEGDRVLADVLRWLDEHAPA